MARDNGRFQDNEELQGPDSGPGSAGYARSRRRSVTVQDDDLDDRAGNLTLDNEDEQQFLRGQKRVSVRRGGVPKKTAKRLKIALIVAAVAFALGATWYLLYDYASSSWRFQVESSDNIEIAGIGNVPKSQVMEPFAADIGRNVFFIPLATRKKQLEEIPWVESATVMRLLPDRIRVQVKERTPVAYVRMGSKIWLIDANGVVMEPPKRDGARGQSKTSPRYSFPALVGMQESEPLSTRAARMRIYMRLIGELDAEGARYTQDLSEVDLSDPDDVKIVVADAAGAVLIHLGDSHFLERYKVYLSRVQEWRAQFNKIESVDLRYDGQIIVNPDRTPVGK